MEELNATRSGGTRLVDLPNGMLDEHERLPAALFITERARTFAVVRLGSPRRNASTTCRAGDSD